MHADGEAKQARLLQQEAELKECAAPLQRYTAAKEDLAKAQDATLTVRISLLARRLPRAF